MARGDYGSDGGNSGDTNPSSAPKPSETSSGNSGTGGSSSVRTGTFEGKDNVDHALKGGFSDGTGNGNVRGGGD